MTPDERAIPWVPYEGLPIGAVFLCELTAAPVEEGRCSVHGGDACLRRYDHSEESEPNLVARLEAEKEAVLGYVQGLIADRDRWEAEADRLRDVAAALEAENAELKHALNSVPTGPTERDIYDAWAAEREEP